VSQWLSVAVGLAQWKNVGLWSAAFPWPALDLIGVNFHPVHGSAPDHFWGVVGSKYWWTRPSFGKEKKSVTDISAISPNILVIAFHFSPLNVKQTCFPGHTVHSLCTLFTFTYLLRCVVYDVNVLLVIVINSSLRLCCAVKFYALLQSNLWTVQAQRRKQIRYLNQLCFPETSSQVTSCKQFSLELSLERWQCR